MEVIGRAINHDSVAGVVSPSSTADQVGGGGEDIDEFAFALVAPLGAKNEGNGHGRGGVLRMVWWMMGTRPVI